MEASFVANIATGFHHRIIVRGRIESQDGADGDLLEIVKFDVLCEKI